MSDDKRSRLESLRARIERELKGRDPWFFPEQWEVDGYLGVGTVMFVAQKPSTGEGEKGGSTHSAKAFQSFYESLKKHGCSNAHLTDLVKERNRVGSLTEEEVDRNWPYLLEEISVVEPTVIVALGRDVLDYIAARLERLVPLWRMTHFAWRFDKGSPVGEAFERDLGRLAAILRAHTGGLS